MDGPTDPDLVFAAAVRAAGARLRAEDAHHLAAALARELASALPGAAVTERRTDGRLVVEAGGGAGIVAALPADLDDVLGDLVAVAGRVARPPHPRGFLVAVAADARWADAAGAGVFRGGDWWPAARDERRRAGRRRPDRRSRDVLEGLPGRVRTVGWPASPVPALPGRALRHVSVLASDFV